MSTVTLQGPDFPMTFSFERRRYDTAVYTWAFLHNGQQAISLGDQWPASQWPKRELFTAGVNALAGVVRVEAAHV